MLYLPFIFFLLLFIYFYSIKGMNGGVYILLVYTISSLFSILLYNSESFHSDISNRHKLNITFSAVFTYCFYITFLIIPIINFGDEKIRSLIEFNVKKLSWFTNGFIFCFILALYFSINDLQMINLEDLSSTRSIVYGEEQTSNTYTGIFYYLKIFVNYFSALWPIAIVLFFYKVCFVKGEMFYKILLIVASLSSVLMNIVIAGRTQIVYWILTFILVYFIFKNLIPRSEKMWIRIVFIISGCFITFYISLVTFSRWGEDGAFYSLLEYLGQPFVNYNDFFNNYTNNQLEFGRIFPLSNMLAGNSFSLENYRSDIWVKNGFNIGIFYTFLGDILVDIGHWGLLVFVIILRFFSSKFLNRKVKGVVTFGQVVLYCFFSLLLLQGIFYYPFWKVSSELFIWVCIIFFYVYNTKIKRAI